MRARAEESVEERERRREEERCVASRGRMRVGKRGGQGRGGKGGGGALFAEAAVAEVRVEPAATALRCLARRAVRLEDERCAARRQEPLLVRARVRARARVSGQGQGLGSGSGLG